jgi:hypothetical protein
MAVLSTVCPVEGCDYWIVFGGHLDPYIRTFRSHMKKSHGQSHFNGDSLDCYLGDAINASIGWDREGEIGEARRSAKALLEAIQ